MDLKNVFGEIKTYDSDRHLDGPPECGVTAAPTLRYSMPVAAVVHTITSLACRPSVWKRSPSPMTRFQREISHSTRARQPYPDARCSPAARLIGTPRKRTISAREVSHGRSSERCWSAAGRRGATARVWRSGARARWPDVTPAQECGGAATAARRGSRNGVAQPGRDGSDADRLA